MSEHRHRFIIVLCALLLAGVALTVAGLPAAQGNFYLDSEGYFKTLPFFQERSLTWSKIRDTLWRNPYPGGRRWIPNLTFLVENRLVGLTPGSGRVVGLLIHALNILLVFLLLFRVLNPMGKDADLSLTASALGALLWGLNPFHAETVFYVIQRMTLLSATFYLVAMLCWLRAREETGTARLPWLSLTLLSTGASILCKENGILVVLGIAVVECVLPAAGSPAGSGKRRGAFLLPLAAGLVLGLALFLALGYNPADIVRSTLSSGKGREFTAGVRLLTEGRVMVSYLGLLFLPLPQHLSLVMKYPLSHSLISPATTSLAWASIILLIALALRRRRTWPLFALAVLWFFANHLLESTVLNLEIAFAHRNYLPSVFLFLPAAALVAGLARKRSWLPWAAAITVSAVFLLGWNARARVWGQPEVFWKDVIAKAPGSLRGYMNLGILYDLQGREKEALEIYRRGAESAFEEKPGFWGDLYCNVGIALMELGRDAEAEPWLDKALSITPNLDYLYNMARLQRTLGNPRKGWLALAKLEKSNPYYPDLHLMKARYHLDAGDREGARREALEELRLYPGNRNARLFLEGLAAR